MRPISRIESLTEAQRQELVQWADEVSYEKAAERAEQKWGCEIPKNSVARFYLRTLPARLLPDTPDTAQAAAEIVQYAATGQPKFAEATIVVLERAAFELALACVHKDEHMEALKNISAMLCRYRNTSVRERMAKVQETKCDLRKEELEWKKSTRTEPKSHSALSTHNSQTSSAPLGGLTVAQFMKSVRPKPVPASLPTRNPDPTPNLSAPENTQPSSTESSPAANTRDDSARTPDNSSIPNHSNSSIEQKRLDHMRRRASSFLKPDPNNPVPRDDSWRLECPCGELHPCPHHEPFPKWVDDLCPWSADFIDQLQKRGIPWTNPDRDLTTKHPASL